MDATWLLFTLGVALIFGKIGDHLMERVELPGVLGEILMGMILGNLVYFGLVSPEYLTLHSSDTFEFLAKLGIIFLLFLGGLDTEVEMLKKTGSIATVSTVLGVFVPLILGWFGLKLMGYPSREAFAGGILLTATSIGITVRVMMDLGVLRSEVGAASLSASVMDDFLGIALIIFAVGSGSVLGLISKMAVFFIITGIVAWYTVDKYLRFAEWLHVEKGVLAMVLALMFLFSALAQHWFDAAIEGAFMAGIVLSRLPEGKKLMEEIKSIAYGLVVPIFFVYTGAMLDLRVFASRDALALAAVLSIIAVIGKVAGRGFGAIIMGWDFKKSLQMGIGSIPRTEVALVDLMVAIHGGAIPQSDAQKFIAATLIFITVSVLITPPLLKWAFREDVEAMKRGEMEERKSSISETKKKIAETKKPRKILKR
ncbi:MAG: cation:proton antiporter [Palaeococcus sp.]|uniref:cation:proton antiporter n=1 Tax=Palaeococcus sp. (in: euryarchaeotes) TaxID=2820298 RepID=UPI0025F78B6B|nr:cation:proton antiporter [Palaeococcus sp. (in: euryarchaeotes)]MCD6559755.1 cation:proton antiporter [Palaeococcus sp. (in: euryarchaeotes)]